MLKKLIALTAACALALAMTLAWGQVDIIEEAGRHYFTELGVTDGITDFNNVVYTWPSADGTSGFQLTTNSSGTLSWAADSGTITALNNATENEMVTVGATTTELEAEANLTFTGSLLTVTGNQVIGNTFGLLVGHATAQAVNYTALTQILGTANEDSRIIMGRWSADANAPGIDFIASNQTAIGSSTIVVDNDRIGTLRFFPDDGNDFSTAAAVFSAEVDDGSPAQDDVGVAFVWQQMPGGMGGLTETMRLTATGVLTLATDLNVANGGTGASTLTEGGVLIGSGVDPITVLSQATNGQLVVGVTSGDPVLAAITGTANEITVTLGSGTITLDIPDAVTLATLTLTNDLTVANGGTGVSTLTDGGVLLGQGAGVVVATAVLADGEFIVGDGTTDPVLESGATLRTSMGLGTGNSVTFAALLTSAADATLQHTMTNTGTSTRGILTRFTQDSGTSAVDTDVGYRAQILVDDSGGTSRVIISIDHIFDDVTSTTMDSSMSFCVQNAANAAACNTTATLNSIGEWTNASGQAMKRYDARSNAVIFGSSILDKISNLMVGRWTHPGNPVNDPSNVRGYGPTAEDFWDAFHLGKDPRELVVDTNGDGVLDAAVPGIGTGTMSGILMAAVQELIIENDQLKFRLDVLEAQ